MQFRCAHGCKYTLVCTSVPRGCAVCGARCNTWLAVGSSTSPAHACVPAGNEYLLRRQRLLLQPPASQRRCPSQSSPQETPIIEKGGAPISQKLPSFLKALDRGCSPVLHLHTAGRLRQEGGREVGLKAGGRLEAMPRHDRQINQDHSCETTPC